ncbi:MAG: hypothetical protein HN521_04900 [Candidatus Latescibacteria bacterium]|jgi:hypothetical protein|nr:hypothetical protein [Candidatus Latescibacterota bacterium]MBT5831415.1 hypothetical protein [Candidatus Latescibacterota bacterium]
MSFNNTSTPNRLKEWWDHAFAVSPPQHAITEDDETLASKVATFIVKRQLTAPAIMLLETSRPFNYVSSQFLTFLSPFISIIFSNNKEFGHFTQFLEKRDSIPCIITHIEKLENQLHG